MLDKNLTAAADMFSLGLLCVALYNSPHRSPLECHASLSTCKRNFSTAGGTPSQTNNYLSSRPIPKDLASNVLPRLLTRRPAGRMTAREFQQSDYFDNILVSTIRFLDSFPAKTANEKQAFLRGLIKVLPSFPKSVMEKKVLPALLEELKDKELLSLILHNVFKIVELLPAGKKAFNKQVRPSLKEIFVTNAKQGAEKDPTRDAGLMIILEQLSVVANNCSGAEFKDGEHYAIVCFTVNALISLFRYPADNICSSRVAYAYACGCRTEEPVNNTIGSGFQHHKERTVPRYCDNFQQNQQSSDQS